MVVGEVVLARRWGLWCSLLPEWAWGVPALLFYAGLLGRPARGAARPVLEAGAGGRGAHIGAAGAARFRPAAGPHRGVWLPAAAAGAEESGWEEWTKCPSTPRVSAGREAVA